MSETVGRIELNGRAYHTEGGAMVSISVERYLTLLDAESAICATELHRSANNGIGLTHTSDLVSAVAAQVNRLEAEIDRLSRALDEAKRSNT